MINGQKDFNFVAKEVANFCQRLCRSAGFDGTLVVAKIINQTTMQQIIQKMSFGKVPSGKPDITPYVVAAKISTLFMSGETITPLQEPIADERVLNYPGALRQEIPYFGNYAIGFSGLPGEHDRLLSALLLHYIANDVFLCHTGFTVSDENDFENTISCWLKQGVQQIKNMDSPDAKRRATWDLMRTEFGCVLEVLLPTKKPDLESDWTNIHFAVAVKEPLKLANFLITMGGGKLDSDFLITPEDGIYIKSVSNKHRQVLGVVIRDWKKEGCF